VFVGGGELLSRANEEALRYIADTEGAFGRDELVRLHRLCRFCAMVGPTGCG
jgi:hypothetical protein